MPEQTTRTHFVRVIIRAAIIIPITGLLMAPTCDQSFEGSKGETGPVVQYRAFGDSIPSGNKGSSSERTSYGSYVNFFAADAAAANGWRVNYKTKTVAGETTSAINNTMNESAQRAMLAQADIITFNGGGNDFLDAQAAYKSSCNKTALVNAINSWKGSWDNVIATVRAYANPDAMIRTMTIYYPHPDKDRSDSCSGEPVFEAVFPLGLAASHYMCVTAEAEGWRCADALRAINCPTDDPRCPDMEWLYNLEAGVGTVAGHRCPRVNGGMMDHECIKDYLAISGDGAYAQDPSNTLLQSGDIHPNEAGHNAIADAHHALGYDDCAACPSPPVPPACGDEKCDAAENAEICPEDCPDACGDGFCTGEENASCSDCPSVCGDDMCTGAENASTCNSDCPDTCGDGFCTGGENASCSDCPAVCGDDMCTSGAEDCNTCGGDCGECPAGSCNGIYYETSGTNNASFSDVDTVQFDIDMAAGATYTISTCDSTSTDTYLRLHDTAGSQLASNDDSCDYQSTITYTATTNGVRVLSLGCYGSNSCEATVTVTPDAKCTDPTGGSGSGGGTGGECAVSESCGSQAPSGCWCDSQCDSYGDCCAGLVDDCS